MTDPTRALNKRLRTLRKTARDLVEKASVAGGEFFLPLADRHSLDLTRQDIALCKAELRSRGVEVDDEPVDVAPPVAQGGPAHQLSSVPQVDGRTVERHLSQLADERRRLSHLKDTDGPDRDLEAKVQLSYAALDRRTQALFRRLGVLAARADLALIAGLLELSEDQADAVLRSLWHRSLVEYNQTSGRWGMHDLVRAFALKLLIEAGEEHTARLRYSEQVIRVFQHPNQRFQDRWVLLVREGAHVESVRTWLYSQPANPQIDRWVIAEISATGVTCSRNDVPYAAWLAERIPHLERALAAARHQHDSVAEGCVLHNLAKAYSALKKHQRAIEYHEQRIAMFQKLGDKNGEGEAVRDLARDYVVLREHQKAVECHTQSAAIFREVGSWREESEALRELAQVCYYHLDQEQAIACHEQRSAIFRKQGDWKGESEALHELAGIYRFVGKTERAIVCFERCVTIAQELGDRHEEARMLCDLGLAYAALDKHQQAIRIWEQALAIFQEVGDNGWQSGIWRDLGMSYLDLGERWQAMSCFEQALIQVQGQAHRTLEWWALDDLGDVYTLLGETRRAIASYEQALPLVSKGENPRRKGIMLGKLGAAHADLGNLTRARRCYNQALQHLRREGDNMSKAHVLNHLGRLHLQKGNPNEALVQSAVALMLVRDIDDREMEGMVREMEGSVLHTIATAHVVLGQLAEAHAHFATSLALLEASENQPELARTRWAYGQFLIQQGERERGLALLDACVAYEQQIGHAQAAGHAALVGRLRADGAQLG